MDMHLGRGFWFGFLLVVIGASIAITLFETAPVAAVRSATAVILVVLGARFISQALQRGRPA
jgi:hypothetical protein